MTPDEAHEVTAVAMDLADVCSQMEVLLAVMRDTQQRLGAAMMRANTIQDVSMQVFLRED